jgi:hypothetical protein
MGIERRVEQLERQGRQRQPYPWGLIETIETEGPDDAQGQARVREALARTEAIAGLWRPGQGARVVEVIRRRAEEHTR